MRADMGRVAEDEASVCMETCSFKSNERKATVEAFGLATFSTKLIFVFGIRGKDV